MKRTLAATMIVKNEAHNLPRLFKSLNGLIDKIYITDTGSTDGTLDYLKSEKALEDSGCPVSLFHFTWCDDFAAARNHNLSMIKEDYWMWVDADDAICQMPGQRDYFLAWKSAAMSVGDAWFVPYRYSFNEKGEAFCCFIRERVFKTKLNMKFNDFIHEGVKIPEGSQCQAVNTWTVDHLRTLDEAQLDKGRNLKILLKNSDKLTSRLKFYLGKEYFDGGEHEKASEVLREVVKKADLNPGDRVLAFQYLVHSLITVKKFVDALEYNILAINLDPLRAEFHCFMGDIYLNMQQPLKAIPFYQAAKSCLDRGGGMAHEFTFHECYNAYPRTNLAKIYFNMGEFEKCIEECRGVDSEETKNIMYEASKGISNTALPTNALDCDDIVITCPAQGAYPWNEKLYSEKGLGGSETAAVEMALWLRQLTKRQVKIFNNSSEVYIGRTGVEYRPAVEAYAYFKKWKPKVHIAWRHATRLTQAPSYVWSHDLITNGADNLNAYDKVMALTEFHENFLMANMGIPRNKIMRTRNGISVDLIKETKKLNLKRNPYKIIFPSSPDRGLDHVIKTLDIVHKEIPEIELHGFYGLGNLLKYGLKSKHDMLVKMIEERPWINYVGNVNKEKLMQEYATSGIWFYPADFIESFAITALEAPFSGCWSIVRHIGALPNTMKDFMKNGLCDVMDIDATDYEAWAKLIVEAIKEEKYKRLENNPINIDKHSWCNVAKEWVGEFNL